jgi:hypothetical protein
MQLRDDEARVVTQLVDELDELLGEDLLGDDLRADEAEGAEGTASGDDAVIAGLSWPGTEEVVAPTDPALLRLLPDAYRDDPDAAAEFRRYTDGTLRDGMHGDIDVVRAGLASASARGQLMLDDDQAQAWLRVLNRIRLVLATRLGIERAEDHDVLDQLGDDDPRATPYLLFGWVGYLLSDLLQAMS